MVKGSYHSLRGYRIVDKRITLTAKGRKPYSFIVGVFACYMYSSKDINMICEDVKDAYHPFIAPKISLRRQTEARFLPIIGCE